MYILEKRKVGSLMGLPTLKVLLNHDCFIDQHYVSRNLPAPRDFRRESVS